MSMGDFQDPASVRLSQRAPTLRRWLGAGAYATLSRWIDPSRQYSQVVYARVLAEVVPDGAVWLDAGCGHQVFKLGSARHEAEIIARARLVVGSDLSLQALRTHRTLSTTVCADLRRLPFAYGTFDVITLNYVAEHLEEPDKTFAELARLLKPSGALVLVTPNCRGYFVRLTRLGRKFIPETLVRRFILLREFRSAEDIFPTFYRANTRNDLTCLMKQAGLMEVSFRMLNDPAVFNFVAPFAALELLFGRLLSMLRLNDLKAGTIIAVYRRTCAHLACSGRQGDEMLDHGGAR
jgi:ubiquinone/menaquinone biosynthesis C-methylase UbiE